ncbi:hypothetical protein BGX26_008836 [Mortierella sp. AD094]|nr:hypothetical protein BGX26_008836 [Mortierella sp. AD094]
MDCIVSLETGRSDIILHVDQPSSQGSLQASVKQSCNDAVPLNDQEDDNVSVEGVVEALSIKEANTAIAELTTHISKSEYEDTASAVDEGEYPSTSELENAFSTIGMAVENDDSRLESLQASPSETSGLEAGSSTSQNEPRLEDVTLTTLQLAISIPLPASPSSSGPNSPETPSDIPPSSLPLLVVQPINNNPPLLFSGVGVQYNISTTLETDTQHSVQLQHTVMQESASLSITNDNSTESCEQLECQQQATLSLVYKEKVGQSTSDNDRDNDGGDERVVNSVPIKIMDLPSRRADDEEDEGGERGTVIILESSYRRHFELASHNNNSETQQQGSHKTVLADSPDTASTFLESSHEITADNGEASEANQNIDSSAEADQRDDLHRTRFMLEPSGLDPDENITFRPGSVSPTDFSLPSSSAPSASSSSAPSPVSNRPRQRPYSHFQPRSIFQDPEPSEKSVFHQSPFQQHRQLRRSHSLPSSPCSPVSSHSVAQQQLLLQQQLGSGSPLTFVRGRSESRKSIVNNEIHERELQLQQPQREQQEEEGEQQEEEGGRENESNEGTRVPSARNSQRFSSSPTQETNEFDEESSTVPLATTTTTTAATTTLGRTQGPQIQLPSSERPRRQSLLSPRQFEVMSQQNENSSSLGGGGSTNGKKGGFGSFLKDHAKRNKNKSTADPPQVVSNASDNSQKQKKCRPQKKQQRPSVKDTPTISFQPHSTEISTDRPSVSGRLILHIPRLPGLKFHFVSLALHLRLKESISWARQDLVSFEIEKHHWSQIVWDKKMMLPFQDRQVEEGGDAGFVAGTRRDLSPAAAVAAAVSASASASASTLESDPGYLSMDSNSIAASSLSVPGGVSSTTTTAAGIHQHTSSSVKSEHHSDKTVSTAIDEWRWEWLLPVSRNEVRPESFEGSMGLVWYELEAKCLFRWDKVGKDGQVIKSDELQSSDGHAVLDGALDARPSAAHRGLGSNKLLKGLGASTNKSIAQVFGKLRAGNKSKKPQHAGDFNLSTKHEEFTKNSLKKSNENLAATAAAQQQATHESEAGENLDATTDNPCDAAETENDIAPDSNSKPQPHSSVDSVPFLIRKTLKLYFNKPPPRASSNPAFFLPSPSMSLPNLPSTRRLKAIIPGAKIQVQIQVPSIITIPGYAHSSRLIPCSKTGGLVEAKKGGNVDSQSKDDDGSHYHGEKIVYSLVSKKNKSRPTAQPAQGQQQQQRHQEDAARYPNTFQAALTVRRVTKHDINSDDMLRRRYENAQLVADAVSSGLAHHHQNSNGRASPRPTVRKRLLSHQSCSNQPAGGEQGDSVLGDGHKPADNRAWRKEIHVRKVRCEFWQKETCRIPMSDVPSRSIRVPLGPGFTYSEKEQDKERMRQCGVNRAHNNQHTTVPSDVNNPVMSEDLQSTLQPPSLQITTASTRKDSSPRSQSPVLPPYGDNGSLYAPLKPPPRFGGGSGMVRKDSSSSTTSSTPQQHGMAHPQIPSNQPFTLLIPVPLDSSNLRQTFAWPSSETPSPIAPPGVIGGFGLESSGVGFGSELDYTSQFTASEMGSFIGNGVETTVRGLNGGVVGAHGNNNNGQSNAPPVKARIEVQHYLAFRVSIDELEFEGEYDRQDCGEFDIGVGGNEEHSIYNSGDDSIVAAIAPSSSAGHISMPLAPLSTSSPAVSCCQAGGNSMVSSPTSPTNGPRSGAGLSPSATSGLATGTSCTPLGHLGCNGPTTLSPSTIEPALSFLNSAAGLLDIDTMCEPGMIVGPASIGMAYDFSRRRGSKASQGTFKSGHTVHGGGGAGSLNQQTLNYSSDAGTTPNMLPPSGSSSGGSGGGLISGAIGAIKKKASGSTLGNNNRQQQHRNGRNVSLQRLKDFVIRVPITIAIQVDEHGQVTSAYGRVNKSESTGGEEASNKTFPSDGAHMGGAGLGNSNYDTRFQREGTRGNVTTTATTTTTNIVTGSSGPTYDSMEGTETFSSMNSMAASAGSEPVMKRMMDDFATTSSSALMFAGIKHRQNRGGGGYVSPSPPSAFANHYNSLQYLQQQQRHHNSSHMGEHVVSGLGYLDTPSAIIHSDGDERKEMHDDEDEEEGDFVVVDAEEMAEDDIDGDPSTRVVKNVLERIRHL